MRQLVDNIVRRSTNFYDETGEHVFAYREKQLHSVVCPSIADITAGYVIEHPLKRKPPGEEESHGNVDYWVRYRNYSLLIELKHCYFAYNRANNPRSSIITKLNSAMEQLGNVRTDQSRWLATETKGLVKIALEAIVFYKESKNRISKRSVKDLDFEELFRKLVENTDLNKMSNTRFLWILNERLLKPLEYNNGIYGMFPAVSFAGHISEKVIH